MVKSRKGKENERYCKAWAASACRTQPGNRRLLPDDEEDGTVEELPSNGPKLALPVTKQPVPTVETNEVQLVDLPFNGSPQTDDVVIEPDQSEMIRKAMSELGKRSAAARAKKKAEQDQVP